MQNQTTSVRALTPWCLPAFDREARRSGQLRADAVDQKIHGSGGKNGKVVVCVLVLDQDQSSSDARLF
jgi:hypothetical protein